MALVWDRLRDLINLVLDWIFGRRGPAVLHPEVDEGVSADGTPLAEWALKRGKFLSMPLSERRAGYKCGDNYVTLGEVQTWKEYFDENELWLRKLADGNICGLLGVDEGLNEKVSIWRGDITTLEIDIIVNAANKTLLGGGGVDGAVHRAAGPLLREECATLNGCETGGAKMTGGYQLPAKYIIHTVGPIEVGDDLLVGCYLNSLNIMKEKEQRTIAFPCISTGVYGFPNERAANLVLETTRKFLKEHRSEIDRVIFCLFLPNDVEIYERLMQKYFPVRPMDPRPPITRASMDLPAVPTGEPGKPESPTGGQAEIHVEAELTEAAAITSKPEDIQKQLPAEVKEQPAEIAVSEKPVETELVQLSPATANEQMPESSDTTEQPMEDQAAQQSIEGTGDVIAEQLKNIDVSEQPPEMELNMGAPETEVPQEPADLDAPQPSPEAEVPEHLAEAESVQQTEAEVPEQFIQNEIAQVIEIQEKDKESKTHQESSIDAPREIEATQLQPAVEVPHQVEEVEAAQSTEESGIVQQSDDVKVSEDTEVPQTSAEVQHTGQSETTQDVREREIQPQELTTEQPTSPQIQPEPEIQSADQQGGKLAEVDISVSDEIQPAFESGVQGDVQTLIDEALEIVDEQMRDDPMADDPVNIIADQQITQESANIPDAESTTDTAAHSHDLEITSATSESVREDDETAPTQGTEQEMANKDTPETPEGVIPENQQGIPDDQTPVASMTQHPVESVELPPVSPPVPTVEESADQQEPAVSPPIQPDSVAVEGTIPQFEEPTQSPDVEPTPQQHLMHEPQLDFPRDTKPPASQEEVSSGIPEGADTVSEPSHPTGDIVEQPSEQNVEGHGLLSDTQQHVVNETSSQSQEIETAAAPAVPPEVAPIAPVVERSPEEGADRPAGSHIDEPPAGSSETVPAKPELLDPNENVQTETTDSNK